MSAADATISREEQMLEELAELDLALARHVQAKALAAEAPDEINALGRTYQRVARSLRQTLALKAKLAREREAEAAKRPPKAEPKPAQPMPGLLSAERRAHIDAVHAAVRPWLEREHPDYLEVDEFEAYEILIDLARHDDDFPETPIATLVARVLEVLGYALPGAGPAEPDPAEPDPGEPAAHDTA